VFDIAEAIGATQYINNSNSATPRPVPNLTVLRECNQHPINAQKVGIDALSKGGIMSNLMKPVGNNIWAARKFHSVARPAGKLRYKKRVTTGHKLNARVATIPIRKPSAASD
jgi:hypothetical protein